MEDGSGDDLFLLKAIFSHLNQSFVHNCALFFIDFMPLFFLKLGILSETGAHIIEQCRANNSLLIPGLDYTRKCLNIIQTLLTHGEDHDRLKLTERNLQFDNGG